MTKNVKSNCQKLQKLSPCSETPRLSKTVKYTMQKFHRKSIHISDTYMIYQKIVKILQNLYGKGILFSRIENWHRNCIYMK